MKKIIFINGSGGSGKDTFINFVDKYKTNKCLIFNVSTIDLIKVVAKKLGWDGQKNQKSRKFLSDLKDLWVNYNDGSFKYINNYIDSFEVVENEKNIIIFVHVREPTEIKRFKRKYKNCSTLLITRPGFEITSNHADKNINDFDYDYIIKNKFGIDYFECQAKKFGEKICTNIKQN